MGSGAGGWGPGAGDRGRPLDGPKKEPRGGACSDAPHRSSVAPSFLRPRPPRGRLGRRCQGGRPLGAASKTELPKPRFAGKVDFWTTPGFSAPPRFERPLARPKTRLKGRRILPGLPRRDSVGCRVLREGLPSRGCPGSAPEAQPGRPSPPGPSASLAQRGPAQPGASPRLVLASQVRPGGPQALPGTTPALEPHRPRDPFGLAPAAHGRREPSSTAINALLSAPPKPQRRKEARLLPPLTPRCGAHQLPCND